MDRFCMGGLQTRSRDRNSRVSGLEKNPGSNSIGLSANLPTLFVPFCYYSQAARHPHDGNCSTGLLGGGDDIARVQPADGGSGGSSCTIHGYAIAGPVNVGDNPWNFAPLAPPLNLTAGSQYTFYVGVSQGGDDQGDN